jgi:hypothetical protein
MIFRLSFSMLSLFLAVCLVSCSDSKSTDGSDRILASVFGHDITLEDIPEDMMQRGQSPDSNALISAYVDQWVRKMLLLHEAEKRIPKSLDIEKLVEDYRQSLLINTLEKQVINEELDTFIRQNELEDIYEVIKENYVQEFPIIRLNYIKIPEKAPRIDRFYEWWNKDEFGKMDQYIQKHANSAILGKNDWWEWNEIQNQIDPVILQKYNLKKPRRIQKNIGEYEYFINIYEFVDKGSVSPLSFIEEQIKNIIIQKRKVNVMDDFMERLYQNEIDNKNIILHSS